MRCENPCSGPRRQAALIGVAYGVALGVVAAVAAALTVNPTLGRVLLTALGLCGAIYLGYDQGPVDDARVLAQMSAVGAYGVTMASYFGARALM